VAWASDSCVIVAVDAKAREVVSVLTPVKIIFPRTDHLVSLLRDDDDCDWDPGDLLFTEYTTDAGYSIDSTHTTDAEDSIDSTRRWSPVDVLSSKLRSSSALVSYNGSLWLSCHTVAYLCANRVELSVFVLIQVVEQVESTVNRVF